MRRLMFWAACGSLFAGAFLILPGAASAQSCCSVTAIDLRSGAVSAKENATGRSFQFRVADGKVLGSLRVGQGVYANFKTSQVSLDGRSACCAIVTGAAGSGERKSEANVAKPTVASKGGGQPQPTAINPTEGTTEGAIRGSTALKTPTISAPLSAGQACCATTALDAASGTVSARATATGQVFAFAVSDRQLFDSLKAGQPVYANFKTGQVSLDGRTACCSIVKTPAPGAVPRSTNAPRSVQIATPLPRTPTPKAVGNLPLRTGEPPVAALSRFQVFPRVFDFGRVLAHATVQAASAVTLFNHGTKPINGVVAHLGAPFAVFPGTRSDLPSGPFTLAPGMSTTLTLVFEPTQPRFQKMDLLITHDDSSEPSPIRIELSGAGDPGLTFPATINFGDVDLGKSESQSFTISNEGSLTVSGEVGAVEGPNANVATFSISGTGSFSLDPGKSRTVTVTFGCKVGGDQIGRMPVHYAGPTAGEGKVFAAVSLDGRCKAYAGQLGIDPASLHFGIVNFGQTVSGNIKLTNTGQKKETVRVPSDEGDNSALRITSGAGIFSLEPGQSHGVTVSGQCFNADRLEERRTIEYRGDPGTPPGHQQISFDALCVPRPSQVSVNPAALDFGAVKIGTSASKSFAVKNVGSVRANCTLTVLSISNEQEFVIVSAPGFGVSPGASQMVTVKFTPGSQPGGAAWLHVYDVGEAGTAHHETSVDLSGSGKP